MKKRPNILFLMSDEHRADVTGYEGNSIVRTPVLDELAGSGVVFSNAYTPSPICIPARQCIAAGQFPSTCGARSYGDDLPPHSMTWARIFSQHAYDTVCCGKLHHMGVDQMQGWRARMASGDVRIDARYIEGAREDEYSRYGRSGLKWSDSKEVLRAGIGKSPHAIADEFSVNAAMQYIQEKFTSPFYDRGGEHEPVLLKVSLLLPHYPYFCDEEKFTYYLNRVEPYLDEEVFDHPFLSRRQVRVGEDVTERDMRRATAAYYGMTETIDAQYGQVLDALKHVGQNLDDWVIIYTSDHGEMLGQHGVWEKQKFFEASARVPLIIRWPEKFAPRVVEENVNLCDLFATLCDLAGLPTPPGRDSRSMLPLMQGESTDWDNETISQFGVNNLMIKRGALKYQSYAAEMPEVLFDLEKNPAETINFLDEPEYSVAVTDFRARRKSLGY